MKYAQQISRHYNHKQYVIAVERPRRAPQQAERRAGGRAHLPDSWPNLAQTHQKHNCVRGNWRQIWSTLVAARSKLIFHKWL